MRYFVLHCLSIFLLIGCTFSAIAFNLRTKTPVNIFSENNRILIILESESKKSLKESVKITIRNFAGEIVAQKTVRLQNNSNEVDFGFLPTGYYEAYCAGEKMSFSVIIDNNKHIDNPGKINVHSSLWMINSAQYKDLMKLIKDAGIEYVRSNLETDDFQPKRNFFNWSKDTQLAYESMKQAEVKGYLYFHDIPKWARADHDEHVIPDNLFDVYNSAYMLAKHFKGKVSVYESWNEPDGIFYKGLPDTLAAFCKAFFLGIKDADQDAIVAGPSFTSTRTKNPALFLNNFLANETSSYMDIFNYHHYGKISEYEATATFIKKLLKKYKVVKPAWVTECSLPGTLLRASKNGRLSDEQMNLLCSWIPKACLKLLQLGVDKIFWFNLQYYTTPSSGATWGLLNPTPKKKIIKFIPRNSIGAGSTIRYPQPNWQKSPTPAFSTLNSLIYILGKAKYLGKLSMPSGTEAYVVDRGNNTAGIVLCNNSVDTIFVDLPWSWNKVIEWRNIVGTPQLKPKAGKVRIKLEDTCEFLVLPFSVVKKDIIYSKTKKDIQKSKQPELSHIVCSLRFPSSMIDKKAFANVFQPGERVNAKLEVCNFSQKKIIANINISFPAGWTSKEKTISMQIPSMSRRLVPLTIKRTKNKNISGIIYVRVVSLDGKQSSHSASLVSVNPKVATPRKELSLKLDKLSQWNISVPANDNVKGIISQSGNAIKLHFIYSGACPRWGLGSFSFLNPINLEKYSGLRFEYRTSINDSGSIKVFLTEPDGARYANYESALNGSKTWKTATVMFYWLGAGHGAQTDRNNGIFDANKIIKIGFGMSPKHADSWLEIRNVRAIAF